MTTTTSKLKRRPIRGAIFGLLIGLSTAAFLVMYAVIAFGTWTPFVVIAAGVILGIVWGMYGPAKRRALPPSRIQTIPTATTAPGEFSGRAQDPAVSAEESAREETVESAKDAAESAKDAAESAKNAAESAKNASEDLGDGPDAT